MLDILYRIPDKEVFFIVSLFLVTLSILGIIIIRRFIPEKLLYSDNTVIGTISALISIIYGVFVGLTALYLINNLTAAGDAVQHEANAAANIYRDSHWLKGPIQTNIQTELKKYLDLVINKEWALMENGKQLDHTGDFIIADIAKELGQYKPITNSELLITKDMLEEIKSLYNAREARIYMSNITLNSEIWIVVLIGALLTISINYFFGMNIYLHITAITAAAFMLSSMIFLLITLDRPFQGEFIIGSEEFENVLTVIHLEEEKKHPYDPLYQ